MTLRNYLLGMMVGTVLCWLSFGLVVFYIDPTKATLSSFVFFFLSLFFSLAGLFTLMGFYVRKWKARDEILFAHIGPAFRQGLFLSSTIVIILILQALKILTWWNLLILLCAVILLEFFFLAK